MLGRKKAVIISLILAYTIAVPVFAYLYFYRTELNYIAAGIILRTYDTPTMKLGFYWDEACTQNVTSFDFGNMTHPNQATVLWKTIYIRNEGSVWNNICWNSTLYSVTTEVQERWLGYPVWEYTQTSINNTGIEPGQVRVTYYGIYLPGYATSGTYNWTLTVWGEHWY